MHAVLAGRLDAGSGQRGFHTSGLDVVALQGGALPRREHQVLTAERSLGVLPGLHPDAGPGLQATVPKDTAFSMTAATNDFTNAGGDGCTMLADGRGVTRGLLATVVADCTSAARTINPVIEGRISPVV